MRRTVLFLALALAASITLAKDNDISKVNGSIHAKSGQSYGDLDTVNGSIRIDAGATVGDVETVNGSISSEDKATLTSASTVNGAINLGQQSKVSGEVSTVNGAITVGKLSNLGADLSTVNGKILIYQSNITGLVSTVNGDITVGTSSQIRGGILVDKNSGISWGKQKTPRILIGPNAVVMGDLVFERPVELLVHNTAKIGKVTGATVQTYTDKPPAPKD